MKKISVTLSLIAVSILTSLQAQATLSNSVQQIASDMGTQQALDATATCDLTTMMGSNGGNLGTVNQLLCIVKTLGITGPMEETKTVSVGGQPLNLHYKAITPGLTVDGVTYTYTLQIWGCGTGCTLASNYLPAIFVSFSADAAKTINKGILINNYSADSGTLKGTSFIKWDMGSATTNKSIVLNMVDCSHPPTMANYTVYKKVGTVATLSNISSNSAGAVNRKSLAIDYAGNSGNWYDDTTVSAGGDSPAWAGGFTRTSSVTDWTYSAHATYGSLTVSPFTTDITGTVLSSGTNQGTNCSNVTANGGVLSVNDGRNVLATPVAPNGGMTLHPTVL